MRTPNPRKMVVKTMSILGMTIFPKTTATFKVLDFDEICASFWREDGPTALVIDVGTITILLVFSLFSCSLKLSMKTWRRMLMKQRERLKSIQKSTILICVFGRFADRLMILQKKYVKKQALSSHLTGC